MDLRHQAIVWGPGWPGWQCLDWLCIAYGCSDCMLRLQPPELGFLVRVLLETLPSVRPGCELASPGQELPTPVFELVEQT